MSNTDILTDEGIAVIVLIQHLDARGRHDVSDSIRAAYNVFDGSSEGALLLEQRLRDIGARHAARLTPEEIAALDRLIADAPALREPGLPTMPRSNGTVALILSALLGIAFGVAALRLDADGTVEPLGLLLTIILPVAVGLIIITLWPNNPKLDLGSHLLQRWFPAFIAMAAAMLTALVLDPGEFRSNLYIMPLMAIISSVSSNIFAFLRDGIARLRRR